jgi:DNA repair protein RadC
MYDYPMTTDDYHPLRISDIDENERPRERLVHLGADSLSQAELLAILLRTGLPGENAVMVGHRLLTKFGGLHGLQRLSFEELCSEKGVGTAKACQIKAAIELGARLSRETPGEKPAIHSPADAANLVLYPMSALDQEELWLLLLDTRNRVMSTVQLYKGSTTSSQVRVGEIFKHAIRAGATSIIVVHNHPSGDPSPSPDDIAITRAITAAGKLLDIEVLDHLVIGTGRFTSMKEKGLGFG